MSLSDVAAAAPQAASQAAEEAPRLELGLASQTLEHGGAVVVPNPSPLTYVVTAGDPVTVNEAKGRPAEQEVAVWVHDDAVWASLVPELDLAPDDVHNALDLLRTAHVTLLLPVGEKPPGVFAPALRAGHVLVFGTRWEPLVPLLEMFPLLYVSSANRTGRAPAATAAAAEAMFAPATPVLDGDALRDLDRPHAATTMLRLARGGGLSLVRQGAQQFDVPPA